MIKALNGEDSTACDISRADIEAFIKVDKEGISKGAKSLHDGWISLFEQYSNADIGHELDSVRNGRPRYYTDGISRSRSIANAVFSSKLNIYNGSDSKENRGDKPRFMNPVITFPGSLCPAKMLWPHPANCFRNLIYRRSSKSAIPSEFATTENAPGTPPGRKSLQKGFRK